MARNVADLALFLDTMAGFCPTDPMTFDAPQAAVGTYSYAVGPNITDRVASVQIAPSVATLAPLQPRLVEPGSTVPPVTPPLSIQN